MATIKKKGVHWMTEEVTILLDKVDEYKPRGTNEWEAVTRAYNISRLSIESLNGRPERDVDSCKTKFKALKNVRKPTGDPSIPPDVKRAKQIQYQIESRMSAVNFDDNDAQEEDDDDQISEEEKEFEDAELQLLTASGTSSANELQTRAESPRLMSPPSVSSVANPPSASAVKRQKLDSAIEAANANIAKSKSFFQMYMAQESIRRERQDRRDEEDREERRQERIRAAEREKTHDMLMMSLLSKILDITKDKNT